MKVENLAISYNGMTVFSDLNVELEKGKIMSLVGPSGCGKTTFLRCISGLTSPTSGTIQLNGCDITKTKPEERPVVLMFQQPLLFPHMTILQNVTYGLKYGKRKLKKKEREEKGLAILEKVDLGSHGERYPHQLSGGQQQRVALARALIVNPDLLLLDEPFSSLDPSLRSSIRLWVKDFLKNEGVTALFVTHDREEAMIIGDEIAVMKDGSFQQTGAPEEVYQNPKSSTVAEMFSEGVHFEESFLPANQLTIRPVSNLKVSDTETIRAVIQYKVYKYGHSFYHLHVPSLKQNVVVSSSQLFNDGDHVDLTYLRSSVQPFHNEQSTIYFTDKARQSR